MNRRAFLRALGFGSVATAAAALSFDIERLLWVPGERAIFLPAEPANTFITPSWVTREALKILEGNFKMAKMFNHEWGREWLNE